MTNFEVNINNFLNNLVTPQQVADYAIAKTLEQGKASVNSHGRCLYRGPEGTKCAIGHIIPDSEYTPEMEGGGIATYGAKTVATKFYNAEDDTDDTEFLQKLQGVHDFAYADTRDGKEFSEAFMTHARKFYNDYNLIWPYGTNR